MKQNELPRGWDDGRVRRVLAHYEAQTEDEAVEEDEASLGAPAASVMEVPVELVPAVREMIARRDT